MIDAMGVFRTTIRIAAAQDPTQWVTLPDVMVDTGSEYSWIARDVLLTLGIAPMRIDRFETATGQIIEREVGFALLQAGERSGGSMVAFAEDGDMTVLGAHGLEALSLRIDLGRKELVPAGPAPAARAA
jgi:predicted aspartyl protease